MKRVLCLAVTALLTTTFLQARQNEPADRATAPSRRLTPATWTPTNMGHIRNEILREFNRRHPFSSTDTISVSTFENIAYEAAMKVENDEGADTTALFSEVDATEVVKALIGLTEDGIFDYSGQGQQNPRAVVDWAYGKEYITTSEYEDFVVIFKDSLWALDIDDLGTDFGKNALCIRDSSRAYLIETSKLDGTEHFSEWASEFSNIG